MHSPHVVIDKRSRLFQLLWWSLEVVDTWKGGSGEYIKKCEYGCGVFYAGGIIFFWMPLAVASSLACYIGMFLFLVLYPIEIKSMAEYLGFLAVLCGTFMVFQMLRLAIVKMSYGAHAKKRHFPGVFILARKYISARVEGAMPLITFVGNKKK
jgi:hypothetical protein